VDPSKGHVCEQQNIKAAKKGKTNPSIAWLRECLLKKTIVS